MKTGPKIPCNSGNNYGGAFIPTIQGLFYTAWYCKRDLHELRGESIQSLNWIKLTEELSSWADTYAVAFPLPLELEVTCT